MDASNPAATTADGFLGGTAAWRTDLYTGRAKVLSFRESIELNERMGVKHTPELKAATHQDRIDAIFGGQERYAQAFIGRSVKRDSDMYQALDALAKDVKVLGIFSDWPATVSYYASCMGLR